MKILESCPVCAGLIIRTTVPMDPPFQIARCNKCNREWRKKPTRKMFDPKKEGFVLTSERKENESAQY